MSHTVRQILNEINRLEKDAIELRRQIEEARANLVKTGEYADPHWFLSTKNKLNIIKQNIKDLHRELRYSQQFDTCFHEAALVTLSKEMYDKVNKMAKDLQRGLKHHDETPKYSNRT